MMRPQIWFVALLLLSLGSAGEAHRVIDTSHRTPPEQPSSEDFSKSVEAVEKDTMKP